MAENTSWVLESDFNSEDCVYRDQCAPGSWPSELVEAIHQERQIKREKDRALPPFVFNRSTQVVLWSLRGYLVFMLILIVFRLING